MPFIPNTPESLIGRTDSKNPSTTCRGITSSGRPCRRPVATSASGVAASSPATPPRRGLAAKLRVDDPSDESLYCWQHKDQASLSARSSPGPRASHTPILEERTSLDTLVDRLGLLEVAQKPSGGRHSAVTPHGGGSVGGSGASSRPPRMTRPKPRQQKKLSFCCCFTIPIEEAAEPPARPKPRPLQPASVAVRPSTPTKPGSRAQRQQQQYLTPQHASRPHRASLPGSLSPSSTSLPGGGGRPSRRRHSSTGSQTAQFMSLIPPAASPQTASLLLAELAKPVSQTDEPGYIYMFWLTPEGVPAAAPPADAARSLLAPPPSTPTRPGAGQRRPSDVLASFAEKAAANGHGDAGKKKKTILLKIGRATNVQRRLNEWTRQCGYNLSLIRYYPYIPSSSGSPGGSSSTGSGRGGNGSSSSSPGGGPVPRKVPHSHKVERLVHIELAGMGLRVSDRERCDACGREHREWFEVDASSRKGVEAVDELIRWWVDWNEALLG